MGDNKHVLNGVSLVKALTVDVDQVSKFSFSSSLTVGNKNQVKPSIEKRIVVKCELIC